MSFDYDDELEHIEVDEGAWEKAFEEEKSGTRASKRMEMCIRDRVVGKTPDSKPEFSVEDEAHRPLEHKYVSTRRDDVSQIYYNQIYDRDFGFDIQFSL